MRMILLTALTFLSIAISFPASADSGEEPGRIFALKGGQGEMQTENWESTYDENAKFFGIEYGWKFSRQLGINLGASYSSSKGKAKTITGRVSNDDVITQLVPIDISFIYRLAFTNNQIAVPYAAAGYTHTFYKTQLNDDERTGGQSGYHIKGGIQFLLDLLESRAANDMSRNWQVENTYLFVEYYMSKVDDYKSDSIDLGSKGIVCGLVFEF